MKDRMGKELSNAEVAGKVANRIKWIWLDLVLFKLNFVSHFIPFHSIRKFYFRLFGIKIGKNSFIHMRTRFFYPAGITIGDGTIIGDACFLDGRKSLKIGNNVDIATGVMIYNSEHDVHSEDFKPIEESVEIEDYAFIGPRAIILPGVKVGRGAVVAAGAVVTSNVKDFEIVGGIPAKPIGERKNKDPHYKLGRARLFQ